MTSTAAYREFLNILNKASTGNVIISQFEQLFEDCQMMFYNENLPVSSDSTNMGRMSRFMVPFVVPVTNGVATFDPDRQMLGEPVLWILGYVNPPCGESVGTSTDIPVPILSLGEFKSQRGLVISGPSFNNPKATMVDSNKVALLPANISHLHGTYWRRPRRIVVGRDPLTTAPAEEPMEGGAGQVDPEWDEIDCHLIIHRCIALGGVKLQNQLLVQAGMAFSREAQH